MRIEREAPFSFAQNSSIGCGGNASVCYYPDSVEQLLSLVKALQRSKTPYLPLGNLTNVLPLDNGYDGAIVRTTRLCGLELGKTAFVYAGASSGQWLAACAKAGWSGAEFLAGIPCTLGGALYMNAGVSGRYIAELVESVLVLRENKLEELPLAECGYAYKRSVFMQSKEIIVGAKLRLAESAPKRVAAQIAEYRKKRARLPKGRSMGCVFKNPENGFAGKLIEGCRLKGVQMGGAKISTEHANFILNEGGATASDILALIARMKAEVYARYGVMLQEEIQYIGKQL